jgi:hypothetical protein
VAIVPAPYARNYDRLARALTAAHAGLRSERGIPGSSARTETVTVELTGEKLARGRRWMLRFGDYDLDVERSARRGGDAAGPARSGGAGGSGGVGGVGGAGGSAEAAEAVHTGREAGTRYQELLYEATRFDLCEEVSIQVAAPEDLEMYSHVRRTGLAPEFRVTRNPQADAPAADAGTEAAAGTDAGPAAEAPSDRADLSSDA